MSDNVIFLLLLNLVYIRGKKEEEEEGKKGISVRMSHHFDSKFAVGRFS